MPAPPRDRFKLLALGEDFFLSSVRTALAQHVDVTTDSAPASALKTLEANQFHVICSDYRVGGTTGIEFFEKAEKLRNSASCLLVTEAADLGPADWKRLPKTIHVLRKPFDDAKLLQMVVRLAEVAWAERSIRALASSDAGAKKPKPK
jgi:DNA-binding NtrC family response regulator